MSLRPQAHEIIRTWAFYTIVKALHHQQTIPWETIAISGWCLASDGSKMSKSKGNVIDPVKLLDEYGADPVRYWTGTSRLGHDTALAPNVLSQGKRLVTKLWNAVKLAHMALEQADISPVSPKADIEAGLITHPLDKWLLGELSETVEKATTAFEAYEYAQALRLMDDFFWRTYCDNYLEIVKNRTRFEGKPDAGQISALHTLWHASQIQLKLFAPFIPYVTDTLHDVLAGSEGADTPTIHARGQWPKLDEQADRAGFREEGEAFVSILAGVRKFKSELQVSMKAPISVLTIVSDADGDITNVIGPVVEDLKAVTNALEVRMGPAPSGARSSLSPDERFTIALEMAPQDS